MQNRIINTSTSTTDWTIGEDGQLTGSRRLHSHLEHDSIINEAFRREYARFCKLNITGLPAYYMTEPEQPEVFISAPMYFPLYETEISSAAAIIRFAASAVKILSQLHAAGETYPSWTPESVAIDSEGNAFLPEPVEGRIRDLLALSSSTMISASEDFCAPELYTGEEADPQSDLYSLGRTIRYLRTRGAGITLPQWFEKLENSLCAAKILRPSSALQVQNAIESQSLVAAEPLISCFYCLDEHPIVFDCCPACGRKPPVLDYVSEGESLVLSKLNENDVVISNLIKRLRALARDPELVLNFITGDIRMYGKKEKEQALLPPVLLVENLPARDVDFLIEYMESSKKSEIKLVRHPKHKKHKAKSGPILVYEPGHPSFTGDPSEKFREKDPSLANLNIKAAPKSAMSPASSWSMFELPLQRLNKLISRNPTLEKQIVAVKQRLNVLRNNSVAAQSSETSLSELYMRMTSINYRLKREENQFEIARLIDEKQNILSAFERFRIEANRRTAARAALMSADSKLKELGEDPDEEQLLNLLASF